MATDVTLIFWLDNLDARNGGGGVEGGGGGSVCLKLGVLTSLQTMNYSPCRKIENLLQFKECVFIQKVLLENFL